VRDQFRRKKMLNAPIHVSDAEFEEKVLNSDVPVLVDFWAPWCGPCRMVAPILDKLAEEFAGKIRVAKVNTDEDAQWAMQYGIQGIPTMLVVHNGEVIREQVGAVPEPYLRALVDEVLEIAGATLAQ
jgi:thioredoxin 1